MTVVERHTVATKTVTGSVCPSACLFVSLSVILLLVVTSTVYKLLSSLFWARHISYDIDITHLVSQPYDTA